MTVDAKLSLIRLHGIQAWCDGQRVLTLDVCYYRTASPSGGHHVERVLDVSSWSRDEVLAWLGY